MELVEFLKNQKRPLLLFLLACGIISYLGMWMHSLLTNEETALPLYANTFSLGREEEEPIFKVHKVVRRKGHSGLVIDIDVRGKFSLNPNETDPYDEDWNIILSTTHGMKVTRLNFRRRICSYHNSMLASRMLQQDQSSWSLAKPVDTADFEQMPGKELAEFKEQLLKTVIYSVKIRTLNEPTCRSQGILSPMNSEDDTFDSKLAKSIPTKNGTHLIFKKSIQVARNPQRMCTDLRQQSTVHQILRTTKLPDKSYYWFSWFSGPDETMLPENRCIMENHLMEDFAYQAFPKTILSTLFCF